MTTEGAPKVAERSAKATEIFELQSKVKELEKEVHVLKQFVTKADRIIASLQDVGAIFGHYRGSDNRLVPAIITNAFPKVGTVDIFVFDINYSGGNYQLTGIELGNLRGQMQPYLAAEPAEEVSDVELAPAS